jgi:hypothetical protein
MNSNPNTSFKFIVVGFITCLALVLACSEDSGVDSHTHSASEIVSGLLANARLNMGTGNGIDSDMLDGQEAAAFAVSIHTHDGADVASGTVANARLNTGSGNGLDADLLDGQEAAAFAAASHTHTLPTPILWVGGSSTMDTTTGTYVTYPLDSVTHNTSGGYFSVNANGTVTVNTAGYYRIHARTQSSASGTPVTSLGRIRKNITTTLVTSRFYHTDAIATNLGPTHSLTCVAYFVSSDTIDVQYDLIASSGVNFNDASNNTSGVTIEYVGP